MKLVGYISIFLGGCAVAFLLFSIGVVDFVDNSSGSQKEPYLAVPTYLSFVSILLTSVTVVLAALAIGIGVVAFYTIREIKDAARETATKVAKKKAVEISADALSEVRVKEIVKGLVAQSIQEQDQLNDWGEPPAEEER